MAAFDAHSGHIVVRVVFDGPLGSGKTANLQQLVHTFSPPRRGELSSPGDRGQGTCFFDWLNLSGGVVAGQPLRAQLVSVPGRYELARRRWQLVRSADVIVFVCDSTPNGIVDARRSFALLRAQLALVSPNVPVIVQANKQDEDGALSPEEVARALGAAEDVEVVAASAARGTGVRDTVVRAIRSAAALAERSVIAGGVDALAPARDEVALLAELSGTAQLARVLGTSDAAVPPFPQEDVADGSVWPRRTGRAALRAVARALAGDRLDAAPRTDGLPIRVRAGDLHLETGPDRRHGSRESARAQLFELAQAQLRLGPLRDPRRTFVLAEDGGATWVWSIASSPLTLAEKIDRAEASGDADALDTALRLHAEAMADALVIAARDRLAFDVSAARFGVAGDHAFYVGDPTPADDDSVVLAIRDEVARYAQRPSCGPTVTRALASAVAERRPLLGRLRTKELE